MNDFTRKTNAQIQREMQDRQFAAAHALEIRRWHRDVARELFIGQATSVGLADDRLDMIAAHCVRAADFLLSAIMAKPAAADPPGDAGDGLSNDGGPRP